MEAEAITQTAYRGYPGGAGKVEGLGCSYGTTLDLVSEAGKGLRGCPAQVVCRELRVSITRSC